MSLVNLPLDQEEISSILSSENNMKATIWSSVKEKDCPQIWDALAVGLAKKIAICKGVGIILPV